jgi:NAD(P)-dependent dehydrogenase (short-subunit alcohol dehydrogenase family)
MTSDPKGRQVLITDGTSAVGVALARACVAAGAAKVWLGHSGASVTLQALEELGGRSRVTPIPLDVTSLDSVKWAANEIAETVDIIINNAELPGSAELQGSTELQRSAEFRAPVATPGQSAVQAAPTEFHRSAGTSDRSAETPAPTENDVHYFGLLRLTEEFGPVMRARAAGGEPFLMVWVNLLSIYAVADLPPYATSSASKAAAAYSLSRSLRAQMQPAGIRVVNVFPGPIADKSIAALSLPQSETPPLPKVEPGALARAIVQALQDGVEDVYPGDVASEWLTRSRDNPKAPERELAARR